MATTSHRNWVVIYETPHPLRARLLATLLQAGGLEAETMRRTRNRTTGLRVPPALATRARELLSGYVGDPDSRQGE